MPASESINLLVCKDGTLETTSLWMTMFMDACQGTFRVTSQTFRNFDDLLHRCPEKFDVITVPSAWISSDSVLARRQYELLKIKAVLLNLRNEDNRIWASVDGGEEIAIENTQDWKQLFFVLKIKCVFRRQPVPSSPIAVETLETGHLHKAVSRSEDGVVLLDENGYVHFCNPSAEKILGIVDIPIKLVALNLRDIMNVQRNGASLFSDFDTFWKSLVSGQILSATTITFVNKANRRVHAEILAEYLGGDNASHLLLIIKDVSERAFLLKTKNLMEASLTLQNRIRQLAAEDLSLEELYESIFDLIISSKMYPLNGKGGIYRWSKKEKRWLPMHASGEYFAPFSQADVLDPELLDAIRKGRLFYSSHLKESVKALSISGQFYIVPLKKRRKMGNLGLLVLGTYELCNPDSLFERNIEELSVVASHIIEAEHNRYQLKKLSSVIEQSPYSILITDRRGVIEYVNPQVCAVSGYCEDEIVGQTPRLFQSGNTPKSTYSQLWRTISRGGMWSGELQNRKKNGELIWEHVQIQGLKNKYGEITHFVGIRSDITIRKQQEEQLDSLVNFDALTGLPNRNLMIDRLGQLIDSARDEMGAQVIVICVMLDQYELIDNSLGSYYSDLLVVETLSVLRKLMWGRSSLGRHDKKQLIITLCDDLNEEEQIELLERLSQQLRFDAKLDENAVQATCSIGLSKLDEMTTSPEALLRASSVAAYKAHELGGGHYQFYRQSFDADLHRLISLQSQLKKAIERQEFFLVYQPQVDLRSGMIIGCEALIRWQHPDKGLIPPVEFISIAEDSGLIQELGAWVITEACKQIRAWQDKGIAPFQVSVNVSVKQLRQIDFVSVLTSAVSQAGIEPKWLDIELTESVVMESPQSTIALLNRIKDMGFGLTIDDFGTGYSSLSYLKQLPVDRVKIDRSFVMNLHQDPEDAAISNAIIALGHKLGLKVLAEGVEEESQLSYLARNGCDEVQGYFFSRPLVVPELFNDLKRGRYELPYLKKHKHRDTLLIIDDEANILKSLKRLFKLDEYRVLTAHSPDEGFELLAKNEVGVILCDQRMPGMSGTEFLSRVKELHPTTIRIILSGYTDLKSVTEAINIGAIYKFFTKPWEDDLLRQNIREAFDYHSMLKQRSTND